MEIQWKYNGNTMEINWKYTGNTMEMQQKYLKSLNQATRQPAQCPASISEK